MLLFFLLLVNESVNFLFSSLFSFFLQIDECCCEGRDAGDGTGKRNERK